MPSRFVLLMAVLMSAVCVHVAQGEPREIPSVKIWDTAQHNAFTDLIFFNGKFYCTFRESDRHVYGRDGQIRIISSEDGENWEPVALLEKKGFDLRDSKLSVTPDGRIMVVIGGSEYRYRQLRRMLSHVSFSDKNGEYFSDPEPAKMHRDFRSKHDWLWRVTWHGDTGYGLVYQPRRPDGENLLWLVKTVDGIKYREVAQLDIPGEPGEATARVSSNGEMFVLVRREGGTKTGWWGCAKPPYEKWTWSDTGHRLGGPNFIELADGRFAVGSRQYMDEDGDEDPAGKKYRTVLYISDRDGAFTEKFTFPSSGDCSYPGMLIHAGYLWFSYYSSHEGKASIYLGRIPVEDL